MKPSDIVRLRRDEIRSVVAAHRAVNPRLFGSAMRGEDTEGSDLDLLIDPTPETTLLDMGAIQFVLQSSLGVVVDVVTPGDLPPRFRDKVVSEAVPL
ncbi:MULTISPECIES: nucleotidyltransferase family protein [Rhodanobacter]|uniref:nucleotidyltransferase family protein n=1 Tax=Rhodanobacter TaxID=75309 RepID=UPI000488BDE6|nr:MULTISPECIES: nucleotidyltransferase family protein [Rhodanobacter]TAN18119.1 MAG: nucleotidyltransferase [Rhodanobacter sp.]UJJ55925.1 nucleotidyltransferase family protein [Rhodanobacter thiooxydans]